MRHVILQATLLLLLLPSAAYAGHSNREVIQTVKRTAPSVSWDSTSIVRGDFDGDGRLDTAISGANQQQVFVAVVLAAHPKKTRTEMLAFGIGTHSTDSICELPAKLTVEPLECSPLDDLLPGCRPSPKAASLVLYGGDCDPINFYWDHKNNKLAWWRV